MIVVIIHTIISKNKVNRKNKILSRPVSSRLNRNGTGFLIYAVAAGVFIIRIVHL
jgi:hypothetical protein